MTAVELRGVKKTYRLDEVELPILKGIDLKIKKNEFVSITGPSGSGKSTMLHLIGALDKPSKGHVIIDGTDISKMNDNQLAGLRGKKIGFVFQSFNLVPRLNALENVMLPMWFAGLDLGNRQRRAEELLTKTGLGHRMKNMPSQLSGGERQRVAVARALANNPEIIVADEPTGNLDSKTGKEIIKMLRDLHAEGSTVIMVTHDPHLADEADRGIKMLDGMIVQDRMN